MRSTGILPVLLYASYLILGPRGLRSEAQQPRRKRLGLRVVARMAKMAMPRRTRAEPPGPRRGCDRIVAWASRPCVARASCPCSYAYPILILGRRGPRSEAQQPRRKRLGLRVVARMAKMAMPRRTRAEPPGSRRGCDRIVAWASRPCVARASCPCSYAYPILILGRRGPRSEAQQPRRKRLGLRVVARMGETPMRRMAKMAMPRNGPATGTRPRASCPCSYTHPT
jgi:hypothetical protein